MAKTELKNLNFSKENIDSIAEIVELSMPLNEHGKEKKNKIKLRESHLPKPPRPNNYRRHIEKIEKNYNNSSDYISL